jgi:Na+/H+ antiporter NhaD/arsenite permease-like protein
MHAQIVEFLEHKFGFGLPVRELCMAVAAFGSLATTPTRVHGENHFNYAPIKEVAFLFIGIFLTMVPALNYLYHFSQSGDLPLKRPGQYYFTSGGLSSVLDNAPTYLTFLKTQMGSLDAESVKRAHAIAVRQGDSTVGEADLAGLNPEQATAVKNAVAALNTYHGDRVLAGTLSENETRVGFLVGDRALNLYLIAISMGSVLFGAMTYIGNGPNFMVKAIAEHAGAPTPSFFGYVFHFSLPILLPVLILVWAIFLRGGGAGY